jgi:hypothetical protein
MLRDNRVNSRLTFGLLARKSQRREKQGRAEYFTPLEFIYFTRQARHLRSRRLPARTVLIRAAEIFIKYSITKVCRS